MLVLRLLLAAALAGALGMEREMTGEPAGFRTHILVGVGSALFAIVSAFGFQAIAAHGPQPVVRADVTRVASQIVVGIGFLGGGAIVKYGASIRGLTTAANLWITAAIGTAVGIGALGLGTATTVITLAALTGLRPIRGVLRRYAAAHDEFSFDADRGVDVQRLLAAARAHGATILDVRLSEEGGAQTIRLSVRLPGRDVASRIVASLAAVPMVRDVDWSG